MLEVLCGNKNVQRILLFLFVNGKCYGTQLHKSLKTPLTPIQKALNRLEKGGLITSYYEGKTRVYQFNSTYPLLGELEQLLKKAYTLLPPDKKKEYYFPSEDYGLNKGVVLDQFLKKLAHVTRLKFQAKTKSQEKNGWNGQGRGEVKVTREGSVYLFEEKGIWQGEEREGVNFRNVFRWTLDRYKGLISLEHLRRGPDHPVFLFYLAPSGKQALTSVDSHLCEGDSYFGQITFDSEHIRLHWRVIGPKKNEEIHYFYS